jgi:5'(3')-deoxyribonucleotidase
MACSAYMRAPMQAFIDLDGVLADYYGGVCRAFGVAKPWPYLCPLGAWNFFVHPPLSLTNEQVTPKMDRNFFANLDLLPDAYEIVQFMESQFEGEVYFLTSHWNTTGCEEGKRQWVHKHFPHFDKRTLIGSCKEACARPTAYLWDDSPVNCDVFKEAGGLAILIPRPWNSRHAECCIKTGRSEGWVERSVR